MRKADCGGDQPLRYILAYAKAAKLPRDERSPAVSRQVIDDPQRKARVEGYRKLAELGLPLFPE